MVSALDTVTVAAFENGGAWLDELREYISDNRRLVKEYISEHIPKLSMIDGAATYLLWIDARKVTCGVKKSSDPHSSIDNEGSVENLAAFIREKTGLYLSDGEEYGAPGFLRMNVACPSSYVEDGLRRLAKGIELWEEYHDL